MNFKRVFSAALFAGGVTLAGLASAAVFPDFTVNPTPFDPRANPFTADVINGNYNETITFGDGVFAISLRFQAGQFVALDNTMPVGNTGLANAAGSFEYGLYGLFTGTGKFNNTPDGRTTFALNPGGALSVFLDPGGPGFGVNLPANTTFNAPADGSTPYGRNNSADDILIGSGFGIDGSGRLECQAGLNCGSFGQTTTFMLTPAGEAFFVAPRPFFNLSFQNGQFNGFATPVSGTTARLGGSLDVSFGVLPEPSTIALFGLALVGLGIARRRQS